VEPEVRDRLNETASQLNAALRTLDEVGAPPEIGAHVDLAKSMLEAFLRTDDEG